MSLAWWQKVCLTLRMLPVSKWVAGASDVTAASDVAAAIEVAGAPGVAEVAMETECSGLAEGQYTVWWRVTLLQACVLIC
jgi:hypothetical protein